MSTLQSYASGNITGSTTFKASETGASALAMIRANTTTLATAASVTSPTFTVTSAKVIEGVMLWLFLSSGTAGTGTFKVDLQKGGVSQASVTVNKSDLPDSTNLSPVPVFFKFTGTATGDGGSNWTIVLTNTSGTGSGVVTYNRNSATTGDATRALRTSTTATAGAGDDLYVLGELTGAGTHNSFTVTMDQTANTAYGNGTVNSTSANGGGIRVSNYGTLSYGTSSSTNYVLRVNGDVEVFWNGTLNVGSSGAEIPRSSTAVLELQQTSATGDFGLILRNNSTASLAGLSRTSGKLITTCKLTSSVTGNNLLPSVGTTNGSPGLLTAIDFGGTATFASAFSDNATNATHSLSSNGSSITNTTQTAQVWLARGTGTNNRFVRFTVGNTSIFTAVTNGFFADIDLQAGTIGACTAIGNGTATSSSIVAVSNGFLVTITGKVSSGVATPSVIINACSAAGTVSFAGAANQCFIYANFVLVTASSIGNTTFNVDQDTGWLSGDVVCIAPTQKTSGDSETFLLNANAGSTSFTSALYPFGLGGPTSNVASVHSGSSPTQAEIGLLTRNVKFRSTSSTLFTYILAEPLATVTASWTEFYYFGVGASTTKNGIVNQSGAVCNPKSYAYCSMHECVTAMSLAPNGANASVNTSVTNCVMFNTSSTGLNLANNITNGDWTISGNLIIRTSGIGFICNDVIGTCSNNVLAGILASSGLALQGATATLNNRIGTFSNITVHTCSSTGILLSANISGLIDTITSYRNVIGLNIQATTNTLADLTWKNLVVFGNSSLTGQVQLGGCDVFRVIGSSVIAGDTSFASSIGINFLFGVVIELDVQSLDMSGSTSIFAPHTAEDLFFPTTFSQTVKGVMNNCKFGAPLVMNAKSGWTADSYIGLEKYNQTAGDHRMELPYGQLKTDSVVYHNVSPSMRITPSSASNKLQSAPRGMGKIYRATNGLATSVSVDVRKSVIGDGAAYNGNQIRLVQRANPSLGQNSDVVIATGSAAAGTWETLTGNSSVPTDDGGWEYFVDCDGTAGFASADNWA